VENMSIAKSNLDWVKRKSLFEKPHKYAGLPEIMIKRANTPLSQEKSLEAKRTKNKGCL
jgi:hypothetical protein